MIKIFDFLSNYLWPNDQSLEKEKEILKKKYEKARNKAVIVNIILHNEGLGLIKPIFSDPSLRKWSRYDPNFINEVSNDGKKIYNKAIYNNVDTRENICGICNESILRNSRSVVALITMEKLEKLQNGDYKIKNVALKSLSSFIYGKNEIPYGEYEPFGKEPSVAFGTGFLISEKNIVTAGHCIYKYANCTEMRDIEKVVFVFDFIMNSENSFINYFSKNNVYFGKKVIEYKNPYEQEMDWAVIELDRSVNRPTVSIGKGEKVKNNTPVYMLGHPSGIPQKLARNAAVVQDISIHYFGANLDAFCGNSGSPVIDENTNEVKGILIRGNLDYEVKENYYDTGERRIVLALVEGYERVQRITDVPKKYFSELRSKPKPQIKKTSPKFKPYAWCHRRQIQTGTEATRNPHRSNCNCGR